MSNNRFCRIIYVDSVILVSGFHLHIVSNLARNRSSSASFRSTLYTLAKVLGDVRAVQIGTVARRVIRRTAGRVTSGLLGKLFR